MSDIKMWAENKEVIPLGTYGILVVIEEADGTRLYEIDGDGVHRWNTERFASQEEAAIAALNQIANVYAAPPPA